MRRRPALPDYPALLMRADRKGGVVSEYVVSNDATGIFIQSFTW